MNFFDLSNKMEVIERATTMEAAEWLMAQVRMLTERFQRVPLCLEIGSWCGHSALALGMAGARVICVDPFDGRDEQCLSRARTLGFSTLSRFIRNVFLAEIPLQILGVVAVSADIAHHFADESLDLVFIDGDHSAPCVKPDVDTLGPKVRVGGILCGHDFYQTDVARAVADLQQAHPNWYPVLERGPDNIWVLPRKG